MCFIEFSADLTKRKFNLEITRSHTHILTTMDDNKSKICTRFVADAEVVLGPNDFHLGGVYELALMAMNPVSEDIKNPNPNRRPFICVEYWTPLVVSNDNSESYKVIINMGLSHKTYHVTKTNNNKKRSLKPIPDWWVYLRTLVWRGVLVDEVFWKIVGYLGYKPKQVIERYFKNMVLVEMVDFKIRSISMYTKKHQHNTQIGYGLSTHNLHEYMLMSEHLAVTVPVPEQVSSSFIRDIQNDHPCYVDMYHLVRRGRIILFSRFH